MKLDTNFIKPFMEGTIETLKVQCSMDFSVGKPFATKEGLTESIDLAAIIGLTCDAFNGSIALCFPTDTFLSIMGGMLGEEFTEVDSDLEDGASELLNIIFGFAKRILNEKGYSIEKAIPAVVRGREIRIAQISQKPSAIIPFTSEKGSFWIQIAIE